MVEQKNSNELCDVQGNPLSVDNIQETLSQNIQIIQKAMNGDQDAFNQLYMQSYRYVFFVVRNYVSDDETTYDVIQEVFIKVFRNISSLRAPEAYYGWLTTIAKNTAKNFLRTKRPETPITEDEDYSDYLTQDQTQKDVALDIETVLKELEPQDAELLSLVYYDGMRVTQIAKMRGVPAATVYTQLNRAKRNLKAQLAVHGIDKTIYSGNFTAMVTTAIRNIIGTSLLSVAIAQQILDSVVNGKGKKEIAVSKVIKQQQKKNILKIASCIVAISMITTILTVLLLIGLGKKPMNNGGNLSSNDSIILSSEETSSQQTSSQQTTSQNSSQEESSQQTDNTTSQNSDTQTTVDNNTHTSSSTDDNSQQESSEELNSDEAINSASSTLSSSSNTSSGAGSSVTEEEPPPYTAATYIYRDATAADCYPPNSIPAQPIEDVIVITGVATAASDGIYTIPETIDGKRVGGIMPSAFCDPDISATVKKVVVPATVKTIWQDAFSACYNLTDIYLCGNTISIYEDAFADPSMRNSQLIIHCSYNCKTSGLYYYRNIASNYDAVYQEWNGGSIQ